MILSNKAKQISPSITLAITSKAKEMKSKGIDVIGFGAGEPDFDTPINIKKSAIDAINSGYTKYTPSTGITSLKEVIIDKFKNDNDIGYEHSQIIVSTGAKQCLSNAFQAILNPGDEVIVPIPYWVSYPELISLADGIPVYVHTEEKDQFKYTLDKLEKALSNKTKAIILNSPNNPTGFIYSYEELKIIANFAKEHDLIIISDEIYEKIVYDDYKHISIASISDDAYKRTIVINGVSKSYSMTGWRIGYAAADKDIVKLMGNIQSHTTSNPNSIAQYASVEAISGDQEDLNIMLKEFKDRRDFIVDRVNKIDKLSCIKPQGAFYVMVNISEIINSKFRDSIIKDSMDFSSILLEEEKVAVVPGAGFGVDNFIRLSYATSMDNIKEGLNRIERFINKL